VTIPPLLSRMLRVAVGDVAVTHDGRIVEPKTDCLIASGFPDQEAAISAAKEMNEIADWFGIIKARAAGHRINCADELERIAAAHGGFLGREASQKTKRVCADVVAQYERSVAIQPRADGDKLPF
jgi:hypothetical protein